MPKKELQIDQNPDYEGTTHLRVKLLSAAGVLLGLYHCCPTII